MITYFVRQFLEGDDCAGCGAAAPWGLVRTATYARPARGNSQPRAGSSAFPNMPFYPLKLPSAPARCLFLRIPICRT